MVPLKLTVPLVKLKVPLFVITPVEVSVTAVVHNREPVALTVRAAQVKLPSTVIVAPPAITTLFAATGTAPPTQLEGELQLPTTALLVIVTAETEPIKKIENNILSISEYLLSITPRVFFIMIVQYTDNQHKGYNN